MAVRAAAVAADVTFVGPTDGAAGATAVTVFRRDCAARGLRFAPSGTCKTIHLPAAQLDQSSLALSLREAAPLHAAALARGPRPLLGKLASSLALGPARPNDATAGHGRARASRPSARPDPARARRLRG